MATDVEVYQLYLQVCVSWMNAKVAKATCEIYDIQMDMYSKRYYLDIMDIS
jgi:hypothetical protein